MKIADRIEADAKICHGKPHVAGTRIMVEQILDLLSADVSIDEIISDEYFPSLTREDVLACIAFANQFLKGEEIAVFEPSGKHTASA